MFLAFRPVQTSCQRFPGSWNFLSWQVRQLRSDDSSSLTIQLALPSPMSERGYNVPFRTIHWVNDDILLGIFNCYRLDQIQYWNDRLGWRNLSQVCQRWRYIIYECSSHLGMYIECTSGRHMVNTLDHLPLLPLSVQYHVPTVPMQDELGLYRTLRLHGRILHTGLSLPPSILHKALALMDGNFPILENIYISNPFSRYSPLPKTPPVTPPETLTLPKAFLAPNLRHLTLCGNGLPKRLHLLTSTVSLVTLELIIPTSSYLRPRLLVARLRSLPLLKELTIFLKIPIPRPSTEMELLGEKRDPITLPSLKTLRFIGVGAYLESFVAQIRVPLLKKLDIRLFNQIAFVLPQLFYLINNTNVFKLSGARVNFCHHEVSVSMSHDRIGPLYFAVRCKPVDWQIDCAAQICHGLIPTLSGVEELSLVNDGQVIPTEMQNGGIDSATWHDLLRTFIGVKQLCIDDRLKEELSRALQVDEVGLDPSFLPNLLSIGVMDETFTLSIGARPTDNLFTSFIDTRQVVGRPVHVKPAAVVSDYPV